MAAVAVDVAMADARVLESDPVAQCPRPVVGVTGSAREVHRSEDDVEGVQIVAKREREFVPGVAVKMKQEGFCVEGRERFFRGSFSRRVLTGGMHEVGMREVLRSTVVRRGPVGIPLVSIPLIMVAA